MTDAELDLLLGDRVIAFIPALKRLTKSTNAAIMLGQALYWSKRTRRDGGWFWKLQDEWQAETCLSKDEQETARKQLRKFAFWHEKREGIPPKLWYRVDRRALAAALEALAAAEEEAESNRLNNRVMPAFEDGECPPINAGDAGERKRSCQGFHDAESTSESTPGVGESAPASPAAEPTPAADPQPDPAPVGLTWHGIWSDYFGRMPGGQEPHQLHELRTDYPQLSLGQWQEVAQKGRAICIETHGEQPRSLKPALDALADILNPLPTNEAKERETNERGRTNTSTPQSGSPRSHRSERQGGRTGAGPTPAQQEYYSTLDHGFVRPRGRVDGSP